jgi:hypothetical protein
MKHQRPALLADLKASAPRIELPTDIDTRLGRAEWAIVDSARDERLSSLDPKSLLARSLRFLFGFEVARPLANARLEALRRFAVKAWHRAELKTRDMRALFEAGFDSNDAWRVLAHVATRRGLMPEVEHWPA